jgi:biopolymer transport protein ExbB
MHRGPRSQTASFRGLLAFAALLAAAAGLLPATPAPAAETFEKARADVEKRLDRSLQELAATRDRIAKEKVPLSRTVSELENEVIGLRREHARLLKIRDSRTIDLTSLRRQVESMGEQEDFVNSRLNEFVRDFEGRLDVSELPTYEARTSAAKLAEKNVNLSAEGKRETQLAVVSAALARLDLQLGGHVFPGAALGPDGVLTEGHFVALGPSVMFAGGDGRVAGVVENRLNAADPVVVPLPGGLASKVADIAAGGRGELPFDATLGKALKTQKARKSLRQYLREGGMVGYTIVVLGATAVLLAIFKSREILGFPVAGPEELDQVLEELGRGDREAALRRARQIEGVAGEMLVTGVEHSGEKRGVLEELFFEEILKVRPVLERFLPFLAITAATAPLLGLLGTVTGMIKTFQLITIFGTGDAKSLSSGISEALVTTAEGLIVAIPILIVHGSLSRMAKHKLSLLEQLSAAFVNGVIALRHSRDEEAA